MAITLPSLIGNSPISADLMYRFYDNKAITPQIRDALQKREDAELRDSDNETLSSLVGGDSKSESKFGPATRVNITDQIIRMNIAEKTPAIKKDEPEKVVPKNRYDALSEIKKRLATEADAEKKAKDEKLQEIADKVAEDEASKKGEETEESGT